MSTTIRQAPEGPDTDNLVVPLEGLTQIPDLAAIDAHIEWARTEEAKGKLSAWYQGRWAKDDAPCGTAYCIAGHTMAQEGYFPVRDYGSGVRWVDPSALIDEHGPAEELSVASTAADLLGITQVKNHLQTAEGRRTDALWDAGVDYEYANYNLFAANNTVADLERIRDDYAIVSGQSTRYRGGVRFDLIDEHIAWAEASHNGKAPAEVGEWDQGDWLYGRVEVDDQGSFKNGWCGTSFCIAGHVALENGGKPILDENGYIDDSNHVYVGDDLVSIPVYADQILGIAKFRSSWDRFKDDVNSDYQGDLFDGANGVVQLKAIRDKYAVAVGVPTRYNLGVGE